ncbi:MAG: M28 family peptidase [Treponema sp.]|nr:M28 family peptidase [Treponema sp.]
MLIKKLTDINGLPSWEDDIRAAIKEEIKGHVDSMFTDRLGNLIAVKNGKAQGAHIGLSAHMDETGMVVKQIEKSGLIKFETWGVLPGILLSKSVKIGKKGVPGVIGAKPVHLQKPPERETVMELDRIYIDIGATSKEDAEKYVQIGDYIAFDSEYRELGKHKIKAKALDDRLGCAAIIEVLKSPVKRKITAIFCVQEEVGLRGSAVAANQVFADIYVNLEGTVCADPEEEEHLRITNQGKGPALSLIDRSSIYLKKYYDMMIKCAKDNKIPLQFRRTSAGGTDSANYHGSHGGTPVIGLAVPCRYIHTPVSICDKRDYKNLVALVKAFVNNYEEETKK